MFPQNTEALAPNVIVFVDRFKEAIQDNRVINVGGL